MKKFLLLLLLMGCASKEVKQKEPSFPVDVATVQQKAVPLFLETIGHVEPIITVDIASRVQGEITNVYFNEGDYVKEGDLLFTVDPRNFQAQVKKNEGLLEEGIVNLKLAQDKVERYRSLVQEEYFSQLDYDSLLTNESNETYICYLLFSRKRAQPNPFLCERPASCYPCYFYRFFYKTFHW